ncbi:hypothetical protein FOA52_001661 [Chlamydomonas sp. UWO 241]|nr:hypothetical protein FOA52_001661 [Chlamydomonas sp. UWO 241]
MTDAAPSGRGAARDQLAAADHLQAVVAFHKWRHACLRSTYRKAVAEALEDVAEDEAAFKELKKSHAELRERHAELIGQHNALSAEHVRSQEAVSELSATATRLYGGTEECEAATKQARDELDAFKTLHEADVRRRDEDLRKHRSATQGLEEQVRSMAQEQGRLLRLLSDRDALVAQYGAEAAGEGARVRTLAAEVERLGNKAELNGAHVATAEQMLTQRADTISTLHAELARLRDKYLSELSELKAARAAAGEASRLKEQLSESQGVASAVAACRDDLRRALDAATAQMVASDERARRLQAAASVREEVVRPLLPRPCLRPLPTYIIAPWSSEAHGDDPPPHPCAPAYALDNASHPLAEDATVIEHLAGELDAKVAEAANLSSKLASTQAVVTQQQAHFARLAAESAEQAKALSDVGAERAMQWRVIGELHAEMSRLAAQAAAGPMLLLSPEGRLTPAAQPSAASAAGAAAAGAGAPHTRPRVSASQQLSAVETQATAMSVLIADKAFGIRALDAKLRAIGAGTSSTPTAQPGPLSHLPAASGHLRQLQGAVSAVLSSLDALSDKLAARPLDAEKLLDELSGTERSLGTGAKVVSAAIASVNAAQVDVVTLDNKLRAAQSTLKEASAALGSWAHHISGLMGQGRSFDDASRSKLCGELGALEGALAAALGGPSGSGGAAAGDPALIECEFGLRSVASSYRELAGLVRDGANLPDGRVRAHMQSTESMAREKEGAVGRLRVSLGKAPVALAGVVKRGMQVADDIVALMDAVEVTGETLGEWADAEADAAAGGRGGGGESVIPTDPFALAGEVLSLRAQLRGAQRVAREAGEAARASASAPASSSDQGAGGSREGSGYVPLEAMQALEAAFETAERQRASDRAALVAQRLRYAGARGTLVDMLDGVRAASLQACVLFGWRAAAAASMVERCQARCDASAAEAERQRGVSRGQAAAAAGVVARLCDDADDADNGSCQC